MTRVKNRVFGGLLGLLASKKGTFSIIVLAIATLALFIGKLDGMYFVGALSFIAGFYNLSSAYVDARNGGNSGSVFPPPSERP